MIPPNGFESSLLFVVVLLFWLVVCVLIVVVFLSVALSGVIVAVSFDFLLLSYLLHFRLF